MYKRKILSVLLACFTLSAVMLAASLLFLTITHTKPYAVQSDSMSPVFHQGDAVFVRPVNARDLKAGDIITVRSLDGSRYFTHRIIRVELENSLVYTKGDNNSSEDPMPADLSLVAGRVWFSVPFIGSISFIAQSKTFLIALSAIVIVLILTGMIAAQIKKRKDGGGVDVPQTNQ